MEEAGHSVPNGKKRGLKKLLLIVCVALVAASAVVIGLLFSAVQTPVPGYGGKNADEWLAQIFTTNQPQAMEAFRKMRPKTLPFVASRMLSPETKWEKFYYRKYQTLPPWLRKHLPEPVFKPTVWERARMVFMAEPDADTMLPRLVRMLADRPPQLRQQTAGIIANLARPGDEAIVPGLSRCLSDPDDDVRWTVAQTLGQIGPGATAAIPALQAALKDPNVMVSINAAESLWMIDHETNACADAMRDGLKKSLPVGARSWAVVSLIDMTPDDASLIPELTAIVKNPDDSYRERAAVALGRFGPPAKEAVPALQKAAKEGYPELRKAALKALQSIDPDAAGKFETKSP